MTAESSTRPQNATRCVSICNQSPQQSISLWLGGAVTKSKRGAIALPVQRDACAEKTGSGFVFASLTRYYDKMIWLCVEKGCAVGDTDISVINSASGEFKGTVPLESHFPQGQRLTSLNHTHTYTHSAALCHQLTLILPTSVNNPQTTHYWAPCLSHSPQFLRSVLQQSNIQAEQNLNLIPLSSQSWQRKPVSTRAVSF